MKGSMLAAVAVGLMCTTVAAFETVAVISGVATARDGDDVAFGRVPIRLQGIAAPEAREPGGREATENLRALVDGNLIVCHLDGSVAGSGGRGAGICYAGGIELNRHQVESGVARDCPAYSAGRYAEAEAQARAGGRDLSAVYDLPGYC